MTSRRLSQIDAFFVAYQEQSGVLMQLGFEVELRGHLRREAVEEALRHLLSRWPQLGQRLHRCVLGLAWNGLTQASALLRESHDEAASVEWRNRPIDPFCEPPFQLLWLKLPGKQLLACRAHHAVLDGEGLFNVYLELLRALANSRTCSRRGEEAENGAHFVQQLEARKETPGRLSIPACSPSRTATCERTLNDIERERLRKRSKAGRIHPLWLCAAAWMRTIHAWNAARHPTFPSHLSLEFPISLRGHAERENSIGNGIWPLTFSADATESMDSLAWILKRQFVRAVRKRFHMLLPRLTAPARYLPWSLFRKLAARPCLTGAATTHFTWLEKESDIHTKLCEWSGGKLQMLAQRLYTPVCLHMRAGLAVIALPELTQLFINYRLAALSTREAGELADTLLSELLLKPATSAIHV